MLKLGNKPIMFGDINGCGACKIQHHMLDTKFKGSFNYIYSPLDKPVGSFMKGMGIPTWYIPTGNGSGYLHEGVISVEGTRGKDGKTIYLKDLITTIKKKPVVKRKFSILKGKSRFGKMDNDIPAIGTLAKDGRNFPNGNLFQTPESFAQQIEKKWGNPLDSGTLGREFGPGKTDQIYSNDYFNNLRMARPGGDLDTALNLNRSCNLYSPMSTPAGNAYPVTYTDGMIYNSPNPQISGFGKKKMNGDIKKWGKELSLLESYIKVHRSHPLRRGIGPESYAFNYRSTNYEKLLPTWKAKIESLVKKINQAKNVKMLEFGKKRRSRFGFLYQQMGPTPNSEYLNSKYSLDNNYAGGGQSAIQRPPIGSNKDLYVYQVKPYDRLNNGITSFGSKKRKEKGIVKLIKPKKVKEGKQKIKNILKLKNKEKIGPGTELTVTSFGKIKVKN